MGSPAARAQLLLLLLVVVGTQIEGICFALLCFALLRLRLCRLSDGLDKKEERGKRGQAD